MVIETGSECINSNDFSDGNKKKSRMRRRRRTEKNRRTEQERRTECSDY